MQGGDAGQEETSPTGKSKGKHGKGRASAKSGPRSSLGSPGGNSEVSKQGALSAQRVLQAAAARGHLAVFFCWRVQGGGSATTGNSPAPPSPVATMNLALPPPPENALAKIYSTGWVDDGVLSRDEAILVRRCWSRPRRCWPQRRDVLLS